MNNTKKICDKEYVYPKHFSICIHNNITKYWSKEKQTKTATKMEYMLMQTIELDIDHIKQKP